MKLATKAAVTEFEKRPAFIVAEETRDEYVLDWMGEGDIGAVLGDGARFIFSKLPKRTDDAATNGFPWDLKYLGFAQFAIPESRAVELIHLFRREKDRLEGIRIYMGEEE